MSLPSSVKPESYNQQLAEKVNHIYEHFQDFDIPTLQIFCSKPKHYRMRAEFNIWHDEDKCYYRMFCPKTKEPFEVTSFPGGSTIINELMLPLIKRINTSPLLKKRLFQINFLTTKTKETLVTLIYHRPLDEEWKEDALILQRALAVQIIGRSRKQKIILNRDYVTEILTVEGKQYHYIQTENSFTQPNADINEHMLSWASHTAKSITSKTQSDLLELYCGNGNFTCVLAEHFNNVLATEVSKTSVALARKNLALNYVNNVKIARLSSEEFTQAINKKRKFLRLGDINLDNYHFSSILIDPPRSGLDQNTEQLTQKFDNIMYVSCNPDTLRTNLSTICQTHRVANIALFDQFPYTHHVEMGVHLIKG